jgi:anti-anti-sigma factor
MTTLLDRTADRLDAAPPRPEPGGSQPRPPATPAAVPPTRAPSRTAPHGGTVRLALRGELGASDHSWLASRLGEMTRSGARTVDVDLSATTHLDAVIARLLLSTSWRLEAHDAQLLLVGPQKQVRRTLRWYGCTHLLAR